jgi:hypothetical protein
VLSSYRINWDALLARVVYRWHWRLALGAALVATALGIATGLIPPVWRGEAALAVEAPPGATVTADGRPWPARLYAGRHTVIAALPDGRTSSADVTLAAGETLALTLPPGLPPPLVRPLPPAAPGTRVGLVWWADGAWRAASTLAAPLASDARGAQATPTPGPSQTVAFGARGAERLSTIDAYAGLADQLHQGERLLEAVYLPSDDRYGDGGLGVVEVRGWDARPATVPLSGELSLVRFAPDGAALLLGERTPAGGEQVSVARRGAARAPVVAVPGSVTRISWSDDGTAAVLHSRDGDRLALTLVRLGPTLAAATIAEGQATFAGDLMPLTWRAGELLWVAPDAEGRPRLWAAPLQSLIPEDRGPLDARALDALPDGTLRVLALHEGRLVVGRASSEQAEGIVLVVEATIPGMALADDLAGIWHAGELLVQSQAGVWLVTFPEKGGG